MHRIAIIHDDRYGDHLPPPDHPERPQRLRAVLDHLGRTGLLPQLLAVAPAPAAIEPVAAVHTKRHLEFIRTVSENGGGLLDGGDTHASEHSWDVALLAAGGVIAAVDAVANAAADSAFCAIRPPGHHAERNEPMGFCLLNNVAIGARYAQQRHGIDRVAILDWDVHHGNGTQHIFEDDPTVLFISLHQYPFYPGTGAESERGSGKGEGFTMNFPLPSGTGEETYLRIFRDVIVPALARFRPGMLFISAGFDAHRADPLGGMELTEESFRSMTDLVRGIAPVVSILEGGYNLDALSGSVQAHLEALRSAGR